MGDSDNWSKPQQNPKTEIAAMPRETSDEHAPIMRPVNMDQTSIAKCPATDDPPDATETAGMARLLEIMRRLRDPQTGCPWDIEQDFTSILPYTIEEAYEVADAIEREAWDELPSELGDMLARHPHVFGSESRDKSAAQQTLDWERIKAEERGPARVLDGVALGLPALTRAVKLQKRAARVGFDWPTTAQVLDKLLEESRELVEARAELSKAEVFEEFGDLLFVMANLARHLDLDPEAALRATNEKFSRRFNRIEDFLAERGRSPAQSDLVEMDDLWNRAKAEEKAARKGAK
jgi:ATP diphosphatase